MPTLGPTPRRTRRLHRIATAAIAAAAILGVGCASPDPWLAPRGAARARLDDGGAAARAPVDSAVFSQARVDAAAPSVRSQEISRLDSDEVRLRNRGMELQEAHNRSIALASALQTYQSKPTEHQRQVAEDALRAYQGSPAVRKFGAVALALSLAACNSISSQINSLNSEERELQAQLTVVDNARKANIALVSALQQVQRDGGTAKSKAAAAKARAAYDAAMSRL